MEKEIIWQTRAEMDVPTNPMQALRESYAGSPKDMAEEKFDAWVYGIICGWDNECYDDLAKKHNWSKDTFEYNQLLHRNYQKCWSLFMESI